MKKAIFALPLALMLAAPAVHSGTSEIKLSEKEQAKFDKKIEGRVAGKPVSCINRHNQRDLTVVGDKYLIYQRGRNAKTIYVNEPYGGCHGADRNALVTSRTLSSLCRGEIAQVIDQTTGSFHASCAFGAFVPYSKPDS